MCSDKVIYTLFLKIKIKLKKEIRTYQLNIILKIPKVRLHHLN